MKKILAFTLLLTFTVMTLHSAASAQVLINGRLIGSVYTFEKFVRGFQSALLDAAYSDFSIHTYFQIAGMLQKKLDEKPDYRFYYVYGTVEEHFQYRRFLVRSLAVLCRCWHRND